eukprot:jgi/Psemu1/41138/gm1.41138_g
MESILRSLYNEHPYLVLTAVTIMKLGTWDILVSNCLYRSNALLELHHDGEEPMGQLAAIFPEWTGGVVTNIGNNWREHCLNNEEEENCDSESPHRKRYGNRTSTSTSTIGFVSSLELPPIPKDWQFKYPPLATRSRSTSNILPTWKTFIENNPTLAQKYGKDLEKERKKKLPKERLEVVMTHCIMEEEYAWLKDRKLGVVTDDQNRQPQKDEDDVGSLAESYASMDITNQSNPTSISSQVPRNDHANNAETDTHNDDNENGNDEQSQSQGQKPSQKVILGMRLCVFKSK